MLLLHGLILVLQQPVQRLAGDVLKLAVEQLLTFGEVGEDFGVLLQRPLARPPRALRAEGPQRLREVQLRGLLRYRNGVFSYVCT